MLAEGDRLRIQEIAGRYRPRRVLLFGSSASDEGEARDIDLAVEGLPPSRFFSFHGDLIFALSKPVDLIDLGKSSKFNEIIRREGELVYG